MPDRVGHVVEVDVLSVAVDPRGDQAEAVEAGGAESGAVGQVEVNRLAVEADGDPALPAGGGRVVA